MCSAGDSAFIRCYRVNEWFFNVGYRFCQFTRLPARIGDLPLRIDIARHIHRPHTNGPAGGQNFLYDSARDCVRPLTTNELFSHTPVSHRICRIYAHSDEYRDLLTSALDSLLGGSGEDDLTNM